MSPMAIDDLVYNLMLKGNSNEEITLALQERGASYEDLVTYIIQESA